MSGKSKGNRENYSSLRKAVTRWRAARRVQQYIQSKELFGGLRKKEQIWQHPTLHRRRVYRQEFQTTGIPSHAGGLLPERQYRSLVSKYDTEQQALEKKIADLSAETERYKAPRINPKRFVELIKKYKYPVALPREMVREIVDKIMIHQAEGQKPNRTLQIDIYFNFIGRYDLELTETELAEKQAEQDALARQKNEHLAE